MVINFSKSSLQTSQRRKIRGQLTPCLNSRSKYLLAQKRFFFPATFQLAKAVALFLKDWLNFNRDRIPQDSQISPGIGYRESGIGVPRPGTSLLVVFHQPHSLVFCSWTSKHYPYYYEKVRDVVEPASEYTITKLHELLNYLAEVTAPTRAYLHKTIPPLLEKVITTKQASILASFLSRIAEYSKLMQLTWTWVFKFNCQFQ